MVLVMFRGGVYIMWEICMNIKDANMDLVFEKKRFV